MSRSVKYEINSPQMRSVVVLILCTYFWIYLRPPDAQILHLFFGGGAVNLLRGRAPPGVWVIPTLVMGDFGPLNVIIHHRDLQKAHPCVNPRILSYQL